jgi:penicillin-binding protein 1A
MRISTLAGRIAYLKTEALRRLLTPNKWYKVATKIIWAALILLVVVMPLYIYLVIRNPADLFGGMPGFTEIENPENDLSSEIISADNVSLGRYFRYNRSQVSYNELPPLLVKTLIASEDHRFMDHSGMDLWSYVRVGYGLLSLNPQGGGSTLTQQTAKNLFKTRGDDLQGKLGKLATPIDLFISKTKEWIIAIRLEQNFTKEEIITLYFNTVPFNNNAFGIKIAAETYFKKKLSKLNIQEEALLVGMLQNPSVFNPVQNPAKALAKRNEVLGKLLTHEIITTKREYDSISKLPIELKFSVQNHNQGIATYFRTIVANEMQKWCKENGYDLFDAGLKIYTTIDSRIQYFAEQAMQEHMGKLQSDFDHEWGQRNPWVNNKGEELKDFLQRKIKQTDYYRFLSKKYGAGSDSVQFFLNQKKRMTVFTWKGDRDTLFSSIDSLRYYNRFLNTGFVAMNPETGEIKAWVGGINHRYFKFDHVSQAKRQAGSTFKPFVYGKAIEDNYSPCNRFTDESPSININGTIYHPANSDGAFGDGRTYTLRQAMAKSLNSVTMQLMERLQPKNVADFAKRLGIESNLDPVYSLGLGTSDVSLLELVGAYSSFVNSGLYTKPFYITRIEDKYGNVLQTFSPESKQVMEKGTANKMVYMLRGGVEEEGGTSRGLSDDVRELNEVGGKTGTTDNASDGWYIGVTQKLVSGVWVGGDERSIHFPSWKMGSGGRSALPMWDLFMQKVYSYRGLGYNKGSFTKPDGQTDFECKDEDSDQQDFNIVN